MESVIVVKLSQADAMALNLESAMEGVTPALMARELIAQGLMVRQAQHACRVAEMETWPSTDDLKYG